MPSLLPLLLLLLPVLQQPAVAEAAPARPGRWPDTVPSPSELRALYSSLGHILQEPDPAPARKDVDLDVLVQAILSRPAPQPLFPLLDDEAVRPKRGGGAGGGNKLSMQLSMSVLADLMRAQTALKQNKSLDKLARLGK